MHFLLNIAPFLALEHKPAPMSFGRQLLQKYNFEFRMGPIKKMFPSSVEILHSISYPWWRSPITHLLVPKGALYSLKASSAHWSQIPLSDDNTQVAPWHSWRPAQLHVTCFGINSTAGMSGDTRHRGSEPLHQIWLLCIVEHAATLTTSSKHCFVPTTLHHVAVCSQKSKWRPLQVRNSSENDCPS